MNTGRMMVKGTGAMAVTAFMKAKFPARFQEWLDHLPDESKRIHSEPILAFQFYTVYDSLVIPIQKICDLFYNGTEKGAWEMGSFSASYALNGFYKIFFKLGSPQFIIDRAARVFSNYYPEGALQVIDSGQNRCILHITKFPEPYRIIDFNIAGWLDGVLILLDKKERIIHITRSMAKGDPVTEYVVTWK